MKSDWTQNNLKNKLNYKKKTVYQIINLNKK